MRPILMYMSRLLAGLLALSLAAQPVCCQNVSNVPQVQAPVGGQGSAAGAGAQAQQGPSAGLSLGSSQLNPSQGLPSVALPQVAPAAIAVSKDAPAAVLPLNGSVSRAAPPTVHPLNGSLSQAAPAAAAVSQHEGRAAAPITAQGSLRSAEAGAARVRETLAKPAQGPAAGEKAAGIASSVFDNSSMSPGSVRSLLGYDPAAVPGTQLSDKDKLSTTVRLIRPAGRPARVVKLSSPEIIQNELFLRQVVRGFPEFGRVFDVPDAVAYTRGWLMPESVMAMERVEASASHPQFERLPLEQRVAHALLTQTFGLSDMNPGSILFPASGKPVLLDFEFARAPTYVSRTRLPTGLILDEMPWVSRHHFNDMADYEPAIRSWKEKFALPETQEALAGMLRKSGVSERRIAQDLAVIRGNVARLEEVLRADVEYANAYVLKEALAGDWHVGLPPESRAKLAPVLSEVNRTAVYGGEGRLQWTLIRAVNAKVAQEVGNPRQGLFAGWSDLAAEELAFFLKHRPQGFTAADLKLIAKLGPAEARAADRVNAIIRNPPPIPTVQTDDLDSGYFTRPSRQVELPVAEGAGRTVRLSMRRGDLVPGPRWSLRHAFKHAFEGWQGRRVLDASLWSRDHWLLAGVAALVPPAMVAGIAAAFGVPAAVLLSAPALAVLAPIAAAGAYLMSRGHLREARYGSKAARASEAFVSGRARELDPALLRSVESFQSTLGGLNSRYGVSWSVEYTDQPGVLAQVDSYERRVVLGIGWVVSDPRALEPRGLSWGLVKNVLTGKSTPRQAWERSREPADRRLGYLADTLRKMREAVEGYELANAASIQGRK